MFSRSHLAYVASAFFDCWAVSLPLQDTAVVAYNEQTHHRSCMHSGLLSNRRTSLYRSNRWRTINHGGILLFQLEYISGDGRGEEEAVSTSLLPSQP